MYILGKSWYIYLLLPETGKGVSSAVKWMREQMLSAEEDEHISIHGLPCFHADTAIRRIITT